MCKKTRTWLGTWDELLEMRVPGHLHQPKFSEVVDEVVLAELLKEKDTTFIARFEGDPDKPLTGYWSWKKDTVRELQVVVSDDIAYKVQFRVTLPA